MEKLLWLGNPFFAEELKNCGWGQVCVRNFNELKLFSWRDLVELAGFEPDVLVVGDKSLPPFVLGVEEFPCLTVFYSVDAHIHSWQPLYAQGFDACLLSLLDFKAKFVGPFLRADRVWWSPPFAKTQDVPDPGAAKKWDGLFVGKLDAALMPRRARFLEGLKKEVPGLHCVSGDYRSLFPQARVIVNQAENADLNFRVFEAMGCGGCLLTPRVGHGLEKMFVDGEHLLFYAPDDPGDAAYRLHFILDHPEIGEYIGAEAAKIIDREHRAIHRAQALTDRLCDLFTEGAENIVAGRRAKASAIRKECLAMPYLLWASELPDDNLKNAYLAAANGNFGLAGIDDRGVEQS